MKMFRDGRPLKRWRYVGAYGPELMICAGDARIGPLRQRFWAIATPDGRLRERTALFGSGGVRLSGPELAIDGDGVRARLRVDEAEGVETLSPHGGSYIWTRKQGGVRVSGLIELDGEPIQFEERGLIDESAGYHARHTVWSWSAGVGVAADGRPVAWNLVTGVHDAPEASERTVWIGGLPTEVGPVEFAADLSSVGDLTFTEWAAREDDTNALLLKTKYRQPFGTFKGTLPDRTDLREGYGVMESHDVHW
ncbi:MAG TPA: DUF2804 family protein [Thermoleophilaceae bacterium]|nr:DUF2804 family protein [Thermoleophilaceae bacterium]